MSAIVGLFTEGLRAQRAGQLAIAERLFCEVLELVPHHGGALHARAIIAHDTGRAAEALEWFEQAAKADPNNAGFLGCFGAALHGAKRDGEALPVLERAAQLQPDNLLVLNNLGIVLSVVGKRDRANSVFQSALQIAPNDPELLNNFGAALRSQGQLEEALATCLRAHELQPALTETHYNLGNIYSDLDRLDDSRKCYERALQLKPGYTTARIGMVRLLRRHGQILAAIQACEQIVQSHPDCLDAYLLLNEILLALHRTAEALAVAEHALRVRPDCPDVFNALGNSYSALESVDEATACYESALRLNPDHSAAHNLGLAYLHQGRHEEAKAIFADTLRRHPADAIAHSTYLSVLMNDPAMDGPSMRAEHIAWAERHAPVEPPDQAFTNPRDPDRRLRVGYVSPDFRNHAVAFFIDPIVTHHDRSAVEVYCYADVEAPDERTARLRARADQWRTSMGWSDHRLAEQIRADRIDILVELAGHTAGNRLCLFARRPAPIQVSYIGYPATTGVAAIDYRLGDAVTDPPDSPPEYAEELVRLPGVFCTYLPAGNCPPIAELPVGARKGVTFGSLNKLDKLNSAVIDAWCRILQQIPDSRLLMARSNLCGRTAERMKDLFAEQGVAPDRVLTAVVQSVNMQHLRIYENIDILLDPFPWTGHTTSCEALWMGVPVVTLRGTRHSGRMVASILTAVGLTDFIADSVEAYVATAVRLSGERSRLGELRRNLRQLMLASPLCQSESFTRGLELAYRAMWQRWCARNP